MSDRVHDRALMCAHRVSVSIHHLQASDQVDDVHINGHRSCRHRPSMSEVFISHVVHDHGHVVEPIRVVSYYHLHGYEFVVASECASMSQIVVHDTAFIENSCPSWSRALIVGSCHRGR